MASCEGRTYERLLLYDKYTEENEMARIIFYSWQNDLKPSTHRYFLDKCIQEAMLIDAIYTAIDGDFTEIACICMRNDLNYW